MGSDHVHRICSFDEADAIVAKNTRYYLNNCVCRSLASQGKTKQSYCGHPLETCLSFGPWAKEEMAKAFPKREATLAEVRRMMQDWKDQGHFFRLMGGEAAVCMCCSCGCGWFFGKEGQRVADPCDKSPFIERTDLSACNLCGACQKVCAWGARKIDGGKLTVTADNCYGCGACEYACPTDAVKMIRRSV